MVQIFQERTKGAEEMDWQETGAAELARRLGQVAVPAESRGDVSKCPRLLEAEDHLNV